MWDQYSLKVVDRIVGRIMDRIQGSNMATTVVLSLYLCGFPGKGTPYLG